MTHLQKNVTDGPCKRLMRQKFKLTNQDSKGGKNWTVLSVYVTRKGIEVGQFFSLETELSIVKYMIQVVSHLNWRQNVSLRLVNCSSLVERRQVG